MNRLVGNLLALSALCLIGLLVPLDAAAGRSQYDPRDGITDPSIA